MESTPSEGQNTTTALEQCSYCGRSAPFTTAILAGLPLGQICTCAIEQRMSARVVRTLRNTGVGVACVEGH